MRLNIKGVLGCAILFAAWSISPASAQNASDQRPLVVMAPASLTGVLTQLEFEYKRQYTHSSSLSFAATSVNARHIINGAPAHLIITAHPVWMRELQDQGLIDDQSIIELAQTSLVIAVRTERNDLLYWEDLTIPRLPKTLIGVGDPKHVPIGVYAKQSLTNTGLWDHLSGKIVPMVNARNSLVSLLRGAVSAGIIYAADAHQYRQELRVIHKLPKDSHDPVVYQMAAITGRLHVGQKDFADLITSPAQRAVWQKYGFQSID